MACSFDGKYVFSAGGNDCTANMWTVNTEYAILLLSNYTLVLNY